MNDKAGKSTNEVPTLQFLLAVFVAIALFELYVIVIALVDNTNILTTNGLTKSIWINRWSQSVRDGIDVSALLYYPFYGGLVHAVPDALAQLGSAKTDYLIPRKMALLNAMFSTFATIALYWALRQLTVRRLAAVFGCLLHVVSAYLFIDSIQSEDAMPGYFFAVLSFAFFVAYLRSGNYAYLLGWALAVSLSSFLQWIVFVPVATGYATAFLLLACRSQDILRMEFRTRDLFNFIILPLIAGLAGCVTFFLIFKTLSDYNLPFFEYLLPSKAGRGWSGWSLNKVSTFLVHILEYNVISLRGNVTGTERVLSDVLSAAVTAVTFLAVTCTLIVRFAERERASIMLFLVVSLFVGLAMALYSQPHDSQLWLSPMMFAPVGMAVLADKILTRYGKPVVPFLTGAVLLCFGYFAVQNLDAAFSNRGRDGRSIVAAHAFVEMFPPDQTFVVWKPNDGAQSYLAVYEYQGDVVSWNASNFQINYDFMIYKDTPGAEAARRLAERIAAEIAAGKRVITNSLWTNTPESFYVANAAIIDRKTSNDFYQTLFARYHATIPMKTAYGEFVELTSLKTQ